MKIILTTFGTLGDLLPFIGIAKELKKLGHEPILATCDFYKEFIENHEIQFAPLAPHFNQIEQDLKIDYSTLMKKATHPVMGPQFAIKKTLMPYLVQSYDELYELCKSADILVSHSYSFAAILVAKKLGIDWCTISLQPVIYFSSHDPSILSSGLPFHKLQPLIGQANYQKVLNLIKWVSKGWFRPMKKKAHLLDLNLQEHPLLDSFRQSRLNIAMFSEQLCSSTFQYSVPINNKFVGFSYFGDNTTLEPRVKEFLSHSPAIIFTLGSSVVVNPGNFYEYSRLACERLGLRAVFLCGDYQFKKPLPDTMIALKWAPHSLVFPYARVVVHQAGMGTCAQALRSGKPQIIVPFANDQPDNAARIKRLGVAVTISPEKYSEQAIYDALILTINDFKMKAKALILKDNINKECGSIKTALLICEDR